MGIYTPKSVQVDFYYVNMTSKRLFDMMIKFYTSPNILYPQKQISGYAHAIVENRYQWNSAGLYVY